MSAFIVHKDTIDLILTAIIAAGIDHSPKPTPASRTVINHADEMGQLLWDENVVSVNYRYNRSDVAPRYSWQPVAQLLSGDSEPRLWLQVEKARRCLEYQSCEHVGWETSRAKHLLDLLEASITHRLEAWPRTPLQWAPDRLDYRGIDEADWHWTRDDGFQAVGLSDEQIA